MKLIFCFSPIEDDRKIVDVDDDIIIEETKFKCGFCNSKFTSVATLKMHVSNIHEGNKNYKCKFCEKVFGQSGTLKDHIINVHQMFHKSEKSFSKITGGENLKIHQKSAQFDKQLDFKVYEEPKQVNGTKFSGISRYFFVSYRVFKMDGGHFEELLSSSR